VRRSSPACFRPAAFLRAPSDLFQPLYEVTLNPSSNPKLHKFLQQVVGFDSVDDESKPIRRIHRKYGRVQLLCKSVVTRLANATDTLGRGSHGLIARFPPPAQWDLPLEPPYPYYIYYMCANLVSLNQLRRERGFSTESAASLFQPINR